MSYLNGIKLEEPDLLFDRIDTSARNKIPSKGLNYFGPYDKSQTNIKILNVTIQ